MGLLKTGLKAAVAVKTADVIHERVLARQQEHAAAQGHPRAGGCGGATCAGRADARGTGSGRAGGGSAITGHGVEARAAQAAR